MVVSTQQADALVQEMSDLVKFLQEENNKLRRENEILKAQADLPATLEYDC